MTPTEQDLAQQLAEHERWEWRPGMGVHVVSSAHGQQPDRLVVADERHWHAAGAGEGRPIWIRYRLDQMRLKHVPDLADPATHGFLWTTLRKEAAPVHVYDESHGIVVECHPGGDRERSTAPTLGEALARALLAAYGGER